jgi:glucose/arabinose dehydrogenase
VFDRDGNALRDPGRPLSSRERAQALDSHLGKVVRIDMDGSVPADNPFVQQAGASPEIWSYGHRNVQGAALHPPPASCGRTSTARRAATSSTARAAGRNYGWPEITFGREYVTGTQDRRGHGARRRRGAAAAVDAVDRAVGHGLLHRRRCSRSGRATCSSAR